MVGNDKKGPKRTRRRAGPAANLGCAIFVIDFMLKTSTDSKERKILTKEECVKKIEGTDKNSDGKLSLEEFIVLYEEVLGVLPRDAAAIPDEATTCVAKSFPISSIKGAGLFI